MLYPKARRDARRFITERCLLAADIDKTLLAQDETERQKFLTSVAPRLLQAAELGANLAILTGNSMAQLASRFLTWLVADLCHTNNLHVLDNFHFFCNSGGVYAHFSKTDPEIAILASQDSPSPEDVLSVLTAIDNQHCRVIAPRFVDETYIARSTILEEDCSQLARILDEHAVNYYRELSAARESYGKTYDLNLLSESGDIVPPRVDLRNVTLGQQGNLRQATVQITLKPVLSFRHAKEKSKVVRLVNRDARTALLAAIQRDFDRLGLDQYVARPGGRASIDVTLQKLDKAYALEFLIDHLNLQGNSRDGMQFGSNTVYLGDEVLVGGGNDYPVTRIPGLLVLAVNPERHLVPFLSGVFVPSSLFWGPDATAEFLTDFNRCANRLLREAENTTPRRKKRPEKSALEVLKRELFSDRIQRKIERIRKEELLSAAEWQSLHAFVTLMSREDPAGRGWLSVLIHELDAIMVQISSYSRVAPPGIGSSHEDN